MLVSRSRYARSVKRIGLTVSVGLALAALPAAAAAPEASPAAVRGCNHKVDFNLKITSARNMRCRAARRVMRRHRGSIARHFDAPDGFSCDRVSGTRLGGEWRCARGRRAFRFVFGD